MSEIKEIPGYSTAKVVGTFIDKYNGYTTDLVCDKTGRTLTMTIGSSEAVYIGLELSNEKFPRPLPYDLINSLLVQLNAKIVMVSIDKIVNGAYTATLVFEQNELGAEFKLDARSSDAIILAMNNKLPIYISNSLMEAVGRS